jgi:hypothetical protein
MTTRGKIWRDSNVAVLEDRAKKITYVPENVGEAFMWRECFPDLLPVDFSGRSLLAPEPRKA